MKARQNQLFRIQVGLVVAAALLLLAGCASKESPFALGDRKDSGKTTPTSIPSGQVATSQAATGPAATQQEQGAQPAGPQPPPKDELIKFANWDDNRIKLTNWIAAYIVAHGLDHPIRIIDVEPDAYQDALTKNDVDIVLEADPAWAQQQADLGNVIVLGTLTSENPEAKIAVHASMSKRAPDVIEFLRSYSPDSDVISKEAAKIRGSRVGVKENAVGLNFLKNFEAMWTPWVPSDAVELVKAEVADGNFSLCREWVIFMPDKYGGVRTKYCIDDPSKHGGNM